jgi:hypothetical protein
MDKVLVKKAEVQYSMSGQPILVTGGGRDRGKGVTLRERAGGLLGGAAGLAGALTGQHRSLGGFLGSAISSADYGRRLGAGAGRFFVGREGQARADLREQAKQARAEQTAADKEAQRQRGQGPLSSINPMARMRRANVAVLDREQQRLADANRRNQAVMAGQRQSAQAYGDIGVQRRRVSQAEELARAKARGQDLGEEDKIFTQAGRQMYEMAAQGMDPRDFGSKVNTAYTARQNQPVDAQGRPLPANFQLMPPSPSAQDASAYNQIVDIEDVGNQEAMQTGTDMTDSMEVKPAEDEEQSEMSREEMLRAMAAAGRKNMQQQTKDNTRQTRMYEF